MSDRGRIDLHGDVGGQVVVGEHNVVINAQYGAQVSYRAEGPPRVRPRPRPLGPAPDRRAPLVGRTDELAAIGTWLSGGRPVQVFGPPGIGKSALLRRFATDQAARGHPVVHLVATGMPLEDLLQELFQCCYETESGRDPDRYKPEPATLRRLLGSLRILLVVDALDATAEDMALLLDMARGCDLLTASQEWVAGFHSRPMRLEGLPENDAFALLAQELGRTPYGYEADAARRLISTVQGHPQTLVQTAAAMNAASRGPAGAQPPWPPPGAFRIDETALAVGVAARLSQTAAGLLRLLCVLDPLPVPAALLDVFGARPDPSVLAELTALRLVEAEGDGFRACGRFAALVAHRTGAVGDAAQLAPPLIQWLRIRATRRAAGEAAAVTGRVLASAAWRGDHTAARDLARAAAPLLALSLHWGVWRRVLDVGTTAARTLGDSASEAYFHHEVQKRRVALSAAAMGAGGGGGGAGMVAAHGGGPGGGVHGGGTPGPGPPGPPGSGAPGHSPVGGHGARAAHRSLRSTVSTHPVAAGVGAVALVASGVFGAVALAGSDGDPVTPSVSPLSSVTGTPPGSPSISPSTPGTPDPSGTEPSRTPADPAPGTEQPSTSPPVVGRPGRPDDPCPPVPLGTRDFGTLTVGEEKTGSESFPWLACDDEKALKVDDPGNWGTSLTSCPPPSGTSGPCAFEVTFTPRKPGNYSARVVIPDDDGDQDITLTVTGTAVAEPTTVPPTSPDAPPGPGPEPEPEPQPGTTSGGPVID
ncbi:NB-ARC domain-containing protein [Streptomyces sp. NPDC102406]|uniref:NB-ARC domain-containing protein n=1 Tax=Streptomyces sp. NPDC102406 TaxID=3366171 RepID=UPI003800B9D9